MQSCGSVEISHGKIRVRLDFLKLMKRRYTRAREAFFGATSATLMPNLLVCKPLLVATACFLVLLL
jgi:hypothetical protein